MKEYSYIFKNDYNHPFKVSGKEFYSYSPKKFSKMYFDKDDYRIVGEAPKKPIDSTDAIGIVDMGKNNISMNIFPKGTFHGFAYVTEGLFCVGRHSYVRVIKKRFF